jgi:hypothetical protein
MKPIYMLLAVFLGLGEAALMIDWVAFADWWALVGLFVLIAGTVTVAAALDRRSGR